MVDERKYQKRQFQRRKTMDDCFNAQQKLRELVERKIQNPVLTQSELKEIPRLAKDALLSYGANYEFRYIMPNGWIVPFGSLHSTLLKTRWICKREFTDVEWHGNNIKLDVRRFWNQINSAFDDIFPKSLSEALARSKESDVREAPTAHRFTLDEKLGDGNESE